MPYPFEVFVSYSNKDDAWARKLYRDIVRTGLIDADKIFLDKEYLKPGVVWKPTMSNAVLKSRHLIVLWSENAQQSNWVHDELAKFSNTIDPEGTGQPREDRKVIFIPLEGENNAYSHYQWINELKTADAYRKGIDNLDPNVWNTVVEKVISAITRNTDFSPILLAVLAMTRERVDYLDLTARLPNGDTLAQAVKKMGIMMAVELLDRLDSRMRITPMRTLSNILAAMGVATQADPDNPHEFKIILPGGDTLAEALRKKGVTNLIQLSEYLSQNPGLPLPGGNTLQQVLDMLWMDMAALENLLIKVALREYYDESPLDWRPFGSNQNKILTIMSKVKRRFNRKLIDLDMRDNRFRWVPIRDFWSGTDEAKEEREKLARQKSVIILDPLSLYDGETFGRYQMIFKAFENEKALILAFAPFELPTPSGVMRTIINDKAIRIFEYFYEPEINSPKSYAKCGPDVGDQVDISRWLLTALRPQVSGVRTVQDAAETAPLRN